MDSPLNAAAAAPRFVGAARPLTAQGLAAAVGGLAVEPEALWSVVSTETSGFGYLPDRRPKLLFERHVFHALTDGRFDRTAPQISARTPGGYGAGGAHQYARLATAMRLDPVAALRSASWGLGQILGDHFARVGFLKVEAMVAAFAGSEDAQLAAMAAFIAGGPIHLALARRDWPAVARLYNGPAFAQNGYAAKLAATYGELRQTGLPDLKVRAAQALLTFLGLDPGPVDGVLGARTTTALQRFQVRSGIAPADGRPNDETLARLGSAVAALPG